MTATRKAAFLVAALVLVVLVVELVSATTLWVIEGRVPAWGFLQAQRVAIARGTGAAAPAPDPEEDLSPWMLQMRQRDAVHPYLGYVSDPGTHPSAGTGAYDPASANLGFVRNVHPVLQRASPDTLVVAVTGGSFAQQIGVRGRLELEERLAAIPRFSGREIRILSLAIGGYKQPQQLLAVEYLLLLGGHLDLVVNIDGFNEVTLPLKDNLPQGVFPIYPRSWSFRMRGLEPEERRLRGMITYLDALRGDVAARFSAAPQRYSMTAALVWRLTDRILAGRAASAEAELLEMDASGRDYQSHGPRFELASEDEARAELVRIWRVSSLQLARIAHANGAGYLHVLQPNQYDPGSKSLTRRERAVAVDPDAPFAASVPAGYPLLRAAAEDLRAVGVPVLDLTGVFADVREAIYIDDCCHVNDLGIAMVADRIAEAVAAMGEGEQGAEAR